MSIEELKSLWEKLGDIPTTEDGVYIDEDFLHFQKGKMIYEIWDWFERQNKRFIVSEQF